MRKLIVIFGIFALLIYSIFTIPLLASDSIVLLPTENVNLNAQYGTTHWFDFTLSGIPSNYYDVENGTYYGWCVQKNMDMTLGVNHSVTLISSLETNLPNGFDEKPWNKINYIINHRQGYSRYYVQMAIWHFTDNENVSSIEYAQALVDAANQNGSTFIPQSGDILAIPIISIPTIQLAFLELIVPPASLQGLVWYDSNADGIQNGEPAEPGLSGVIVRLYNSSDFLIGETQTNLEGIYSFGSQKSGGYYLQFIPKSGHIFTIKDAGTNDSRDSDADPTTGKTIIFNISADQNVSITNWDAGMYKQSSGGTPTPPEEEPVTNKRPTADATSGEPYRGFVNSSITFNGSRSYDLDGRIISYRWNFGDGTNGTGETTTHIYTIPGNYIVSLLVTDDDFATDMYTTSALVTLGNNPPAKPSITGPLYGLTIESYQYTIVAIDPDGDSLRYVVDWGDGTQFKSSFSPSGTSVQTTHQWNAPGFYQVEVNATDPYNETSEITKLTIAINVRYVKDYGHLIDENSDGIFDQFHSDTTGIETTVKQQTDGKYLIDSDGDGTYDLIYDPYTDQTQKYTELPLLEYVIIILVILVILSICILYLLRKRARS